MKEIIATEQIFSPISNGKPVAIRYHYADGTTAERPIVRETDRADLPKPVQDAIKSVEDKFK